MAIVKATYTRKRAGAKASVRYIQHRLGQDGQRVTRLLFGRDGVMERPLAYEMIDQAKKGSIFWRFVISPDPTKEDSERDLYLCEITKHTMSMFEERLGKEVAWVAAVHADHAPHRHVHVIAITQTRLAVEDFQALRNTATEACLQQRLERERAR